MEQQLKERVEAILKAAQQETMNHKMKVVAIAESMSKSIAGIYEGKVVTQKNNNIH